MRRILYAFLILWLPSLALADIDIGGFNWYEVNPSVTGMDSAATADSFSIRNISYKVLMFGRTAMVFYASGGAGNKPKLSVLRKSGSSYTLYDSSSIPFGVQSPNDSTDTMHYQIGSLPHFDSLYVLAGGSGTTYCGMLNKYVSGDSSVTTQAFISGSARSWRTGYRPSVWKRNSAATNDYNIYLGVGRNGTPGRDQSLVSTGGVGAGEAFTLVGNSTVGPNGNPFKQITIGQRSLRITGPTTTNHYQASYRETANDTYCKQYTFSGSGANDGDTMYTKTHTTTTQWLGLELWDAEPYRGDPYEDSILQVDVKTNGSIWLHRYRFGVSGTNAADTLYRASDSTLIDSSKVAGAYTKAPAEATQNTHSCPNISWVWKKNGGGPTDTFYVTYVLWTDTTNLNTTAFIAARKCVLNTNGSITVGARSAIGPEGYAGNEILALEAAPIVTTFGTGGAGAPDTTALLMAWKNDASGTNMDSIFVGICEFTAMPVQAFQFTEATTGADSVSSDPVIIPRGFHEGPWSFSDKSVLLYYPFGANTPRLLRSTDTGQSWTTKITPFGTSSAPRYALNGVRYGDSVFFVATGSNSTTTPVTLSLWRKTDSAWTDSIKNATYTMTGSSNQPPIAVHGDTVSTFIRYNNSGTDGYISYATLPPEVDWTTQIGVFTANYGQRFRASNAWFIHDLTGDVIWCGTPNCWDTVLSGVGLPTYITSNSLAPELYQFTPAHGNPSSDSLLCLKVLADGSIWANKYTLANIGGACPDNGTMTKVTNDSVMIADPAGINPVLATQNTHACPTASWREGTDTVDVYYIRPVDTANPATTAEIWRVTMVWPALTASTPVRIKEADNITINNLASAMATPRIGNYFYHWLQWINDTSASNQEKLFVAYERITSTAPTASTLNPRRRRLMNTWGAIETTPMDRRYSDVMTLAGLR